MGYLDWIRGNKCQSEFLTASSEINFIREEKKTTKEINVFTLAYAYFNDLSFVLCSHATKLDAKKN